MKVDARPPRLDQLYSVMQGCESRLGGGDGVEGIYGSIAKSGMVKIFDCMSRNCGFGESSYLVDIGAGLGRPQLHAAILGIRGSRGIELDEVKVTKARAFIKQTIDEMHRRGADEKNPLKLITPPDIICSSVERMHSLEPATHAYSFWEGIPMSARASFGRLFKSSSSCKAVTVVQRSMREKDPAGQMFELGFGPLMLITSFAVKMSGSGASFQAYVFSKPSPSAMSAFKVGRSSLGSSLPLPVPTLQGAEANVSEEKEEGSIERGSKRQRVTKASAMDQKRLPFKSSRTRGRGGKSRVI